MEQVIPVILLEGRRVHWHEDKHKEGTIMFADDSCVSILWDEHKGAKLDYSDYDRSELGNTILLIVSVVQQSDIERIFAQAQTNTHRAFRVWMKLTDALFQVIDGKRHPDAAFDEIAIRDCLSRYDVLATTWNIDDIRDHMPFYKTDEDLYSELLDLESGLNNVAVSTGNEVIADHFPADLDQEVLIMKAWAVKDGQAGYGNIYTDEDEAREEHTDEELLDGFTISGGESIRDFVEDKFRDFYESKEELLEEINQIQGMTEHVNDMSED
jgi:hypothetical protein